MATAPMFVSLRRDAVSVLMDVSAGRLPALLHWGAEAGATSAYLQVRAQNTPALRLYESMGFKTAYGYHYRVPG